MNSIKAFLSPCATIDTESDLRAGMLNVLMQNDQPARMFDRNQQSQPFVVAPIDDPESLGEVGVAFFDLVAEDSEWIVVIDRANQVRGIIEPKRAKELRIAAYATIKRGEFSGKSTPAPGNVEVTVTFYGCLKHPETGRFALHQIGSPIPRCPLCGEPMVKLQEKNNRAKLQH